MTRIHAVGGLCNRLRAILSRRAIHGNIEVCWRADEPVSSAHFLDVFEPLHGVTWVGDGGPDEWAPAPGAPVGWVLSYAELRPVAEVQRRIGWGMPYNAVHIRRTDYIPNCLVIGEPARPVSEWIDWAREQRLPCYVATDNAQTQRTMAEAGFRFVGTHLPDGDENRTTQHRYGALSDAVVDLYMCVRAERFKGSKHSSFSETIEVMRGLR